MKQSKKIMTDISKSIDEYTLRKIFSTGSNIKTVAEYISKNINKPIENGLNGKPTETTSIIFLEENWNYKLGCEIARKLFFQRDSNGVYQNKKYAKMIKAENAFLEKANKLVDSENENWTFSQGKFDNFAQNIIRNDSLLDKQKKELLHEGVDSYFNIVSYNYNRNDFIELLMIENNENILPTLKHINGVDYFIDGIAFDQKVSKSLGKEYIKQYKDINQAIKSAQEHPEKLIESLFSNADSGRFNALTNQNKIYFVFMDGIQPPVAIKFNILKDKFKVINMKTKYNLNGIEQEIEYKAILILI